MGFGHQVQKALEQRQQHLIARGLAKRHDDGAISYRPELLATLQRHELDRVGEYLAAKRNEGSIYIPMTDSTLIRGTYRRSIMLASGKFAVIPSSRSFNGTNTSHWFHGAQSLSATAGVMSLAWSAARVSHGRLACSEIGVSLDEPPSWPIP